MSCHLMSSHRSRSDEKTFANRLPEVTQIASWKGIVVKRRRRTATRALFCDEKTVTSPFVTSSCGDGPFGWFYLAAETPLPVMPCFRARTPNARHASRRTFIVTFPGWRRALVLLIVYRKI